MKERGMDKCDLLHLENKMFEGIKEGESGSSYCTDLTCWLFENHHPLVTTWAQENSQETNKLLSFLGEFFSVMNGVISEE